MFETDIEIRYSSLKLDRLPILYSTLKNIENWELVKKYGVTDIKVGNFFLKKVQTRIIKIREKHFFEIKGRELKLGMCISYSEDGNFTVKMGDYYYEIYVVDNYKRLLSNIKMLQEIFLGKQIKIYGSNLSGTMYFENRIEVIKGNLLQETFEKLSKNGNEKLLREGNSIYTLTLLNYLNENRNMELDSWVNLRADSIYRDSFLKEKFEVERVHKIKGEKYNLLERVVITGLNRIDTDKDKIVVYRQPCKIYLEKILKES